MLYHHVKAPRSGVDIEQMVIRLREPIGPDRFRRAWQRLVDRHASFRTGFDWSGSGIPTQHEYEEAPLEWAEEDLRGAAAPERDERIREFLRRDRERGFDLGSASLCRGSLFRLAEAEWEFVWTFHHICADGYTYPGLVNEAFAQYEGTVSADLGNSSPSVTYRDYVAWLDANLALTGDEAKSYWQKSLRGFTAATPLPGAGADNTATGQAECSLELSREATASLESFAADNGLTVNTLVLAAWARLLSVHADTDDVVFGQTRACRRDTMPGAEELVGILINTVPVRIAVDPELSVTDWLKSIRASQNRLSRFERTPLADIQSWSDLAPGAPPFESLVVFTPRLVGAALREQGGKWRDRDIRFIEQTSYKLTLFAYHEPELLLKLAHDRSRVTEAAAARCLRQLATVLETLPQAAERRVGELGLVDAGERRLLVATWNETATAYARSQTVHELFEAQAARTPAATAVAFRDRSLTYAELDARADRLARRLRAGGAGPGRLVGVCLGRSIDLVVALLGVLKSGAAYVPMDPAFPRQRLAWMVEDTEAPIVVTDRAAAGAVPVRAGTQAMLVDEDDGPEPAVDAAGGARPDDLAYVIFTSGSTGRPKGVMVEHRNVANFFTGMDRSLGFSEPGTWLAVTSVSFDISVLELLWTLTRGFKVVVQEEARASARLSAESRRKMDFSLFYFAADAAEGDGAERYRLLMEGARFADRNGFTAVWTPERHFHPFGGLYPNPALTSAALAAATDRIHIRAGSIVLPLHNPIRVAEEWSVVDNLSGGRVGLSFASGWHASDFALMPQNYEARREVTFRGIETVRALWRGETITAADGRGEPVELRIYPPPLQRDPPIWVTSAGDVETFRTAGRIGANLLTNLLGQKVEELAGKIAAYRAARREHGHPGDGVVTLMLHTFVGADLDEVRRTVRDPFISYLKTSTDLIRRTRWEFPAFANAPGHGAGSGGGGESDLAEADLEAVVEHAFQRYFDTSGLFGTPETCCGMVDRLQAVGIDEIACLIDFGVDVDSVLASLSRLDELRRRFDAPEDYSIAAQIRRHQVTHLQCTPSLARVLVEDREALAALNSLRKLIVGGEALPPRLAAQLAETVTGDVVNMYGPTETTIWSTSAPVSRGVETVTIGRPIANTRTYVVDRSLQLVPAGVAGELLIGGDGVTRGYLNRPDLTDERFVPDTIGDGGGRLYRTGDRVRHREDGTIEFLGRLDQQVKISGYRIEPGEIERTLEAHPAVRECAVAARLSAAGDAALAAFVTVAQSARDTGDWRAVWDGVYAGADGRSAEPPDPTMNTAGWTSSFTGKAIPAGQMREWVDHTVDRILALRLRRVLEIGCGTGMLLLRVAPHCESYTAIDFSETAVGYVRREVERQGLTNVSVERAAADALPKFPRGAFDAVILNSVVQYFPGPEYLADVIERASALVAPGGAIFVGDIRSLPLLEAFHAAVELESAEPALPVATLRRRIRERASRESELVLSPEFFGALRRRVPAIARVETQLKRGRHRNELTCFRYDAVLRIGVAGPAPSGFAVEDGGSVTLETVRNRLAAGAPVVAFLGIPDRRVAKAAHAARTAMADGAPETVGELIACLAGESEPGIEPEDLYAAAGPYDLHLSPSAEKPGFFDAVFARGAPAAAALPSAGAPGRPLAEYTNGLAIAGNEPDIVAEIKNFARQRLPEYMVPGTVVVLPSLPRTANGKLDRNALPSDAPETPPAKEAYAAPKNELEKTITGVLRDLLGVTEIGIHDNFFDLGANSLMMMRANARLRETLRRDLALVELFEHPTVSALAAHLERPASAAPRLEQSQQRAVARIGAMQRRRIDLRNK